MVTQIGRVDDVYAASRYEKNIERSRAALWRVDEDAALSFDQAISPSRSWAAPGAAPSEAPSAASETLMSQDTGRVPLVDAAEPDWEEMLKRTDEGFSEALMRLIDERGLTDAQCYKKANVDRKLFSKIRSNPAYRPSKPTVFAFAIALELELSEANSLLGKAGFALSHSSKFDIIMEYFLKTRNYDIYAINEVLFHYDMPLLGSA